MSWITPDVAEEEAGSSEWDFPERVIDEDTGTVATMEADGSNWSPTIELTFNDGKHLVRGFELWVGSETSYFRFEYWNYLEEDWENPHFDHPIAVQDGWQGSEQLCYFGCCYSDKFRISVQANFGRGVHYYEIHEFKLWEVEVESVSMEGLIAWLRMEETFGSEVADSSGKGNDFRAAGSLDSCAGVFGNGHRTTPSKTYHAQGIQNDFSDDAFTIVFYVKVNSADEDDYLCAKYINPGSNSRVFRLYLKNTLSSFSKLRLHYGDGNDGSYQGYRESVDYVLATWYHFQFALVYNGTRWNLYANGVLKDFPKIGGDNENGIYNNDVAFYIGADGAGSNLVDGDFDNFMVFNGVALTVEQLGWLMINEFPSVSAYPATHLNKGMGEAG
jgi:hypothetical protein